MKIRSENGSKLRNTARSAPSKYRRKLRDRVLRVWNNTCAYCDKQDKPLFLDHILSRSKGGQFKLFNLAAACNECNKAKKDMDLEVFVTDSKRLEIIKTHVKRFEEIYYAI